MSTPEHHGTVTVKSRSKSGRKTYLAACSCGWERQVPSQVEGRRSLQRHALDASIVDASRRNDSD